MPQVPDARYRDHKIEAQEICVFISDRIRKPLRHKSLNFQKIFKYNFKIGWKRTVLSSTGEGENKSLSLDNSNVA